MKYDKQFGDQRFYDAEHQGSGRPGSPGGKGKAAKPAYGKLDLSDPQKVDWHLQALMQTGDVRLLQKFIAANPEAFDGCSGGGLPGIGSASDYIQRANEQKLGEHGNGGKAKLGN